MTKYSLTARSHWYKFLNFRNFDITTLWYSCNGIPQYMHVLYVLGHTKCKTIITCFTKTSEKNVFFESKQHILESKSYIHTRIYWLCWKNNSTCTTQNIGLSDVFLLKFFGIASLAPKDKKPRIALRWRMRRCFTITKTCLYIFDPFKPHLYIVKLGFTGVYIIFLISAQIHRLWVLVRTTSSRRF